jgi:phosphoribosylanthranilate isomerase
MRLRPTRAVSDANSKSESWNVLRVKICGNRTCGDLALAGAAGADAVGLIVGVRHRSEDGLSPAAAAALLRDIPVFVNSVLVTHLITAVEVLQLHQTVPTSTIQLHDAIAVADVQKIRRAIPHIPLIKAVGVTDEGAIDIARRFEPYVDGLLLDTHAGDRIGGTGVVHDWSISRRIVASVNIPVILAGGLKPENVIQAIRAVQPYGVDVNSGVEFPNGEKDPDRVREFIRMAKSCADGFPSM